MQMIQQFMQFISTHSLTRRLTKSQYTTGKRSSYFNSQPHEEADAKENSNNVYKYISTHSLTRRLTGEDHGSA